MATENLELAAEPPLAVSPLFPEPELPFWEPELPFPDPELPFPDPELPFPSTVQLPPWAQLTTRPPEAGD